MNRRDINLITEQYARLYTEDKVRSLNDSGVKYINEDEFGEFEEPQQAEVAIEVYIRREGDRFVEYSKKTLYNDIKGRLEEHGIDVTPYKQTFTNGSSVLELTAHVEGTPEQAIDYDIEQIEHAVRETTGGEGNRFNFDVYIAGDYPE